MLNCRRGFRTKNTGGGGGVLMWEFNAHTEVAGFTKVAPLTVWQKLDLRKTVLDWYTHRSGERLRILIDCSGCNGAIVPSLFKSGASNRPFLVITTEPAASKRVRRRALDCSSATGGQCCKEMFYVNFKQLGWDDWVIAPPGYFANYCRGDCSGLRTPDDTVNSHSHLIEEYRKMDQLAGLQPCCTPTKFSAQSLIYHGPDHTVIKRDLPKMVVEECGCP
ncbi:hypothetical protein GE061_016828 [Apolygus lucorum]|uniref:TGF-beta family profile domain-containing protein n=1 Tax=Apolygus lucorum TaxID=248454 RepID=A0A8S9XIJ0_APOLU|nr:hypothetical protein GE061_016828 [Apolygus lucorum]